MYSIEYKDRAAKFLERLGKDTAERIFNKIESLKSNPFPHDSIKIKDSDNLYRLRIGKYRALYRVYKKELIIAIVKIDLREGFYDEI